MLLVGFLFAGGDFHLDRFVKLQEYCGRSFFAPYFDPKKTADCLYSYRRSATGFCKSAS
jgi:hypothetical protein